MDKTKNLNVLGTMSLSAIKKLTKYAKPKFRALIIPVVPTITTVLMKSFVLGVIIYGTHEAKVWGTTDETAGLWMKIFKSQKEYVRKQDDFL